MNSKSNAELLPCPHCGESEELYPAYRTVGGKPYAIDCLGCGADFIPREGTDVIEAWNRRKSRIEAISEAEPDGWQHRIYYEDTGKWSEWRDGKWNLRKTLVNKFEERPLFAHTPPAGHVVVPVEVMQARLDTLDACLETFWCITKDGSDNRLIAEGAQHEAASLRALLPHNQGGAK